MKRVISYTILFCFSLLLFSQEILFAVELKRQRYTLAVLPLTAQDRISDSQAQKLSSQLNSELGKFDIFEPMAQTQIEQILRANNFDPQNCSSQYCAIKAGKILGTRLVANGVVRKVGPLYFIEVRIIHVQSGQTVQSVKEEFEGNFKDFKKYMQVVASKLVGLQQSQVQAVGQTQQAEPIQEPQQGAMSSVVPVENETQGSQNPLANEQPTIRKSNKKRWVLLGLFVAGGIGAGVYLSHRSNSATSQGNASQVTILPIPPTFP